MSYRTDSFDDIIVDLLKGGAVGFMPTDTVYGLSCLASEQAAVERIYDLKKRDANKPFIILIPEISHASKLGINPGALKPLSRIWPAPLSVICPAGPAPKYLHRGTQSLALRVPADESLRRLLATTGPLVSTSANLSEKPPVNDTDQAEQVFGERLDFYIDKGPLTGKPSTLAKLENGQLKISDAALSG